MAAHDPKGFYKALNVSPDATQLEIRLAYKFLKQAYKDGKKLTNVGKIQSAYQTLCDPKLRSQYDGHAEGAPDTTRPAPPRSKLESAPVLAGVGAACLIAFAFAFGPALSSRWVSFEVGDEIVWKQTSKLLGEVVEYDEAYDFPEADEQAAYKIRMRSGVAQWFPAADLHRGARAR